jgi:hypothetical protein
MVLVAVLMVTIATWALLAMLLAQSFLHHRLAVGAERGAVAGAAAERAVAERLAEAAALRAATGAWPVGAQVADVGACRLDLVEVSAADGWWRVRVRAEFEGALAWREGTVHAAR